MGSVEIGSRDLRRRRAGDGHRCDLGDGGRLNRSKAAAVSCAAERLSRHPSGLTMRKRTTVIDVRPNATGHEHQRNCHSKN